MSRPGYVAVVRGLVRGTGQTPVEARQRARDRLLADKDYALLSEEAAVYYVDGSEVRRHDASRTLLAMAQGVELPPRAKMSQHCRIMGDHVHCPGETTLGTSACECPCHRAAS